ncbi:hypothetical protein QTP88_021764 [Uroleucon formosanum]
MALSCIDFQKYNSICTKWISNSGNISLIHLTPDDLYKKRLCMEHFINNDFINEKTKNLKKNAVPKKYEEPQSIKVLTPTKTYGGHTHFLKTPQTPVYKKRQNCDDFDEMHIQTPKKIFKNTDNKSPCFTSDLTPKTTLLFDSTRNFPSPSIQSSTNSSRSSSNKSLFKIVEKLENTIKNKNLKNKRSSISKLRNSLSTYKSKFKNYDILNTFDFPSNESKTLVKMQVSRKIKTTKQWASDEKNLALSIFYKTPSTYKCLRNSKNINLPAEYSKYLDLVEGYEDLGPLGRFICFMEVTNFFFFTSTSVKHTDLSILLMDVIEKLLDCGFIVTAIICDQGKNNVAALVKDLKMTKDKPFVEVKGRKIFSIFDVPYIFKNIRNNFKSNNFIFKEKEAHMNPGPFQLMSCKLVMQLFSNSIAAAMETCIMTKQLKSNTALNTLDMVKELNNLLDVLNSKSLFDKNPFKCAISQERPQQLEFLFKTKSWLENLKKKRPPCFDGLLWTINAIDMLYNQQKLQEYNYLLTNRLTSDVIENTFSIFRQIGGYNRNPTARVFRTTFRINVKINLMRPSIFSNCEEDTDIHLLNNDNHDDAAKHNIEDFNEISDSSSSVSSASLSSTPITEERETGYSSSMTLEQCSNTYFSGYLGKKCVEKFKCRLNESVMLKETNDEQFNEKEFLIFCKNYDSQSSNLFLRRPTNLFEKCIYHAQLIIKKNG